MIGLRSPELLEITDENAVTRFGARQLWYSGRRQRMTGCGPTVCATVMWYFSETRLGCASLCHHDGNRREGFSRLMQDVWHYMTPGAIGIRNVQIFAYGAMSYGYGKGVPLSCRTLNVPAAKHTRPSGEQFHEFIAGALADDLPVAFLNRSNGALKNLCSWHWVTVTAVDGRLTAEIADDGIRQYIDLSAWLDTTVLGGGLVVLRPVSQ